MKRSIGLLCLLVLAGWAYAQQNVSFREGNVVSPQVNEDHSVTFRVRAPQAENVMVLGDWAANKVVYQIFPTRFASSRPVPDRIWYQAPIGPSTDLKGDLRGILSRLPYLRDLGVDVLYLTPIFQANSCHKYDTVDYFQVDSRLGTEEDLRQLVQQAHAMGMRVILDAVFNHTSRDFFAFRDILEKGETSPYCSWYYIRSFPIRTKRGEKPTYKTFSYYGGMPKLNLQNPQVQEYVFQVVRYWMRACQIDGWRLDVGDEISHSFWKAFRKVVKAENPQALIVGEVWHYAGDFLEGDEWDTMMNYDFQGAVLGFVHGGPQAATQFVQRMGFLRGNAHTHVYPVLWNLIDSHDTQRAMRSCGDNPDRFRLAAAMQLLSTGMFDDASVRTLMERSLRSGKTAVTSMLMSELYSRRNGEKGA